MNYFLALHELLFTFKIYMCFVIFINTMCQSELDAKRAIDMGTRLAYKIGDHEFKRGMDLVSNKVGTEEKMMNMLSRFVKK